MTDLSAAGEPADGGYDTTERAVLGRTESVYRRAFRAHLAMEKHVREQEQQPGQLGALLGGCKPCMLRGLGKRDVGCEIDAELQSAYAAVVDHENQP